MAATKGEVVSDNVNSLYKVATEWASDTSEEGIATATAKVIGQVRDLFDERDWELVTVNTFCCVTTVGSLCVGVTAVGMAI